MKNIPKTIKFNAPPLDSMEVFNACAALMMNDKKNKVDKIKCLNYLDATFSNITPNIHLDFNDGDGPNWTPLMVACYYQFTEGVKKLLDLGADPNLTMLKDDKTVLEVSAVHTNYEITKILLDAGANPNYQDKNGNNFLLTSLESKGKKAEKYLDNILNTDLIDLIENTPEGKNLPDIAESFGNLNGSIIVNNYTIKKMLTRADISEEFSADFATEFKI